MTDHMIKEDGRGYCGWDVIGEDKIIGKGIFNAVPPDLISPFVAEDVGKERRR